MERRARVTLIGAATLTKHGYAHEFVQGRTHIVRGDAVALFEHESKELFLFEPIEDVAPPPAPAPEPEAAPAPAVEAAAPSMTAAVPPAGEAFDEDDEILEDDDEVIEEEPPATEAAPAKTVKRSGSRRKATRVK